MKRCIGIAQPWLYSSYLQTLHRTYCHSYSAYSHTVFSLATILTVIFICQPSATFCYLCQSHSPFFPYASLQTLSIKSASLMPLSFSMPASWPSLLQPLFKCSAIRLLNLLILCQPLDPFCFLCQPPTHSVPFPAYFISQFCSSASLPYLLFPRSASYPLGFLCQLLTPFCCSASLLLFLFLCQPPALSVTSASFLPLLSHIRASYPFMLPLPASYPICPLCEPPTLFYYLCQPPTCSVSSASLLPLLLPLKASYPFCPLCQPPTPSVPYASLLPLSSVTSVWYPIPADGFTGRNLHELCSRTC